LPAARGKIRRAAELLGEDAAARARPSDMAQALFDLGATVCTETPTCGICPWVHGCAGRRAGIAAKLPLRAGKKPRPERFGAHFWLSDFDGRVLLRRRPPHGLLGGMTELPGTQWRAAPWAAADALEFAPMPAEWRAAGLVFHGFTHFRLRIDLYAAAVPRIEAEGFLRPAASLGAEALPSLMRKCVRTVLG
jgi:A/G-specific adenine glycosylase